MAPQREYTVVIIKPDGVGAGEDVLHRIEQYFTKAGLKIESLYLAEVSRPKWEEHYAEHRGQRYFDSLVEFMSRGTVKVMLLRGEDAIRKARAVVGATRPREADPGTIRRDLIAFTNPQNPCSNLVHASDSVASAERERSLWFPKPAG